MNLRLELTRLLSLAYVLSSSFMFWMGLSLFTDCHSPIVVVLSGSMEPAFQRGDILFLWNKNKVNNVGDVVVYEVSGKSIPIVHRVIKQHQDESSGEQLLLTKGDNNHGDDVPLYTRGKYYLNKKKDVVGTVKGYLPQLGYVTIWISENKIAKFALLGVLMLSSLISNES
ncbi:Signal peptidase complex catalytic subunit SEC11 [Kluyveromyces marxianus]|uniref:Signal peptidase complex catalytic subunit SEC11 n=2 Tax=Kluyveromyces marxianus TaxID=4911 RepID=W0TH63_KLUMD|nr:signal peptidase complex catalytic subunit SEC11 [Kluyveromyces marxianus DMKU3-1042]QGN17402.1 signal peptidase complex catalytic subunit SEC11 [Kluyveromyces marxianus]BAO41449.1 signal peptidase complex catalytic subunit SEC11 [Kluyveromyces marxianus DMKU3-1042]BAP72898.1 signal peptidase complex catalytic subunit SEC11 [Kluyveromyces marxianus]